MFNKKIELIPLHTQQRKMAASLAHYSDYVRKNSLNLRNTMACGDKVVFCSRVNSPEDLINRFTAKCAMDEIENTYEYLENLSAKLINVIISYGINKTDNILKVLDITEVILSDNKVIYNPLFKLNFKKENNEVESFYERTGNISKKIERSLLLAGYSLKIFLNLFKNNKTNKNKAF